MARLFRFLLPFALLGIGAFAFVQLKSSGPQDQAASPAERSWPVEAATVEFKQLAPTVRLYGRIESPRESRLRAALAADVLTSSVLIGQSVTKGQSLMQLDDTDARLMLAQREADLAEIEAQIISENNRYVTDVAALEQDKQLLALAKTNLERATKLAETQSGSQANVDSALEAVARQTLAVTVRQNMIQDHPARVAQLRARLKRATAMRDQARRDLEHTQITAPFDGRVTAVHVSPGDRTRPGDALVEIFDLDYTEVRAQIPNRYLAKLRDSLAQNEKIPASTTMDGIDVPLQLVRLAGKVEIGDGGVDGFFQLTAGHPELELGRTLAILVTLPEEPEVIALPITAIYGADAAYRISDGRLERVRLTRVGEYRNGEWGSWSLFRSEDLKPGDIVLTGQLPNAVEGLRVEVVESRD